MNSNELIAYLSNNKKAKIIAISIIAFIIITIIVVVILKIKGVGQTIRDSETNAKLAKQLDEEITEDKITITQQQLNSYASKLYAAMKGWGTDEESIYDVFRVIQTRSDVLQLIKTFGVKDHMTLNEWLNDELSADEIYKINEILAGNNINYKF